MNSGLHEGLLAGGKDQNRNGICCEAADLPDGIERLDLLLNTDYMKTHPDHSDTVRNCRDFYFILNRAGVRIPEILNRQIEKIQKIFPEAELDERIFIRAEKSLDMLEAALIECCDRELEKIAGILPVEFQAVRLMLIRDGLIMQESPFSSENDYKDLYRCWRNRGTQALRGRCGEICRSIEESLDRSTYISGQVFVYNLFRLRDALHALDREKIGVPAYLTDFLAFSIQRIQACGDLFDPFCLHTKRSQEIFEKMDQAFETSARALENLRIQNKIHKEEEILADLTAIEQVIEMNGMLGRDLQSGFEF